MIGAGKYDDITTLVRNVTHAQAAIVIILGGDKGSGFSVQTLDGAGVIDKLPEILRDVAMRIEADLAK
jgi:hypothetical protein